MEPASGWKRAHVYSIGHSTRTLLDFIDLLREYGIRTLADVRSLPGSRRLPHFDREVLERELPLAEIAYAHIPQLGGLRHGRKDSPNAAWRNASFRAYADYMATDSFVEGLERLRKLAQHGPVAVMCAEAVPWRCHRSLIADALYARGVEVHDIEGLRRAPLHRPTPFARFDGTHVSYPPPADGQDALLP